MAKNSSFVISVGSYFAAGASFLLSNTLFVVIMATCHKDLHQNLFVANAVNQAMFLRKASAPSSFRLPFQWFGVASPRAWMNLQLFNQF